MEAVGQSIREHILSVYLEGEDASELTPSTPLITTGILDSMATLKLALFLEGQFAISVAPSEIGVEHLDTIERMVELVQSKYALAG
jgi:acyl carrier protein